MRGHVFNLSQVLADRELDMVRSVAVAPGPFMAYRTALFRSLAYRIKQLFLDYPKMPFLRLKVTLRLIDQRRDDIDRHIRIEHVIDVQAPRCPELATEDARVRFFIEHVPFWVIGDGEVLVKPDTPGFSVFMALPPQSSLENLMVNAAATHLESHFQMLSSGYYVNQAR